MIGAIAGDIIGSVHERAATKQKDFPLWDVHARFTDDSVLTVAIAHALLTRCSWQQAVLAFGRRHPDAGYGGTFIRWLSSEDPRPYNSWGNGSAMRVSPIAWASADEEEVLREAADSAAITHDHPEGIKGAQATALAIFLARAGTSKEVIRTRLCDMFGYDLGRSIDQVRPHYRFDVSCQGSVPEAIIAFLDATDWEDAVRNAISLGGDADTQACIAGAIAEAYYGVPAAIALEARRRLSPDLLEVVDAFEARFGSR